jgi:hypothetical protein
MWHAASELPGACPSALNRSSRPRTKGFSPLSGLPATARRLRRALRREYDRQHVSQRLPRHSPVASILPRAVVRSLEPPRLQEPADRLRTDLSNLRSLCDREKKGQGWWCLRIAHAGYRRCLTERDGAGVRGQSRSGSRQLRFFHGGFRMLGQRVPRPIGDVEDRPELDLSPVAVIRGHCHLRWFENDPR